jgi:hypothetical protein
MASLVLFLSILKMPETQKQCKMLNYNKAKGLTIVN